MFGSLKDRPGVNVSDSQGLPLVQSSNTEVGDPRLRSRMRLFSLPSAALAVL